MSYSDVAENYSDKKFNFTEIKNYFTELQHVAVQRVRVGEMGNDFCPKFEKCCRFKLQVATLLVAEFIPEKMM